MKQTRIKIIVFVLSAILMINCLPKFTLPARAANTSGECGDNLTWSFDESTGKLTITGSGKMWDWHSSIDAPWSSFPESIRSLSLPDGLTSIGAYAFYNFRNMASVTIPNSVTTIGNGAFMNCTGLKSVTIPNGVTSIGSFAFDGCASLSTIMIPNSVTDLAGSGFSNCSSLTEINVASNNSKYYSVNGVLFEKERITLIAYPGGKRGAYQIPEGVESINNNAFSGCLGLTSVTIPSSVNFVGSYAFSNCTNLIAINVVENNNTYCSINGVLFDKDNTTIIRFPCGGSGTYQIPPGITMIYPYAFEGCINLTRLMIPDSVNYLGQGAFFACKGLKSVTIPSGVTTISSNAFYNCRSLKNVMIPKSVSFIEDEAFSWCSELTDVFYGGDIAAWGDIEIGTGNNDLNCNMHFNSSGIIYTITYNANGGTSAPSAQEKTEEVSLKLSTQKPTKTYTITYNANGGSVSSSAKTVNCTFQSWNTTSNGSGTPYLPGGSYTSDESATLYAQWENPTAGTLITPTRSGYSFDGWFTAANGGSTVTSATAIGGNLTIYAHWTPISYAVTYNANGGTGVPAAQTKIEGVALALSSTKPTKNYTITYNANGGSVSLTGKTVSCTFKNWNTAANGAGTSYASGASYTADADVTLYAQWTNSTAGELPTPVRNGYTFDGWYTAASGGSKVTSSATVSENLTIYAHWTKIPAGAFAVSYDANGGTGAPAAQTKTEGVTLKLSTQKPTKNYTITFNANGGSVSSSVKTVNCTFQSWNTRSNGGGTSYLPGGSYTSDESATLYAQWENPTAGTLITPTRSGYSFNGWYSAASGGSKVTSSTTVSGNLTIYAHWKEDETPPSEEYSGKCGANLTWSFDESSGKLTISGSGAMTNWDSNEKVPWYSIAGNIRSISFPTGLTSIGSYAFYLCSGLTSVTIPNKVTSISKFAFQFCSGLKSAIVGAGVVKIAEGIFRDCDNLTSVTIQNPKCDIYQSSATTLGDPGKTTIYGYEGSTAQRFAKDKGYRFKTMTNQFVDVNSTAYYAPAVEWAVQVSVTTGTTPTTFSPGRTCTRAQVVTFLWRAKGCPEPTLTDNPFADVNSGAYYYKAVLWAVEKGITNGVDPTHFGPDRGCTRAQVVTFQWRANGQPEPSSTVNPFTDVKSDAYYYKAVLWAVEQGITKGTSADRFSPNATCTRGQIVTFLYRDLAE